jgi:ABC-type transport system substrate-binding protein
MAAGDSSLASLSLEAVEGFRAFADGEAEHVSGLTAPTPATVRVALTTPFSVLPIVMSSPILSVIDPETVAGDLRDIDLSGGWTVASEDDGDLVLDSRTEEGNVRTIELQAHDDEDAAYEAFEDGDVDWAQVPSSSYDQAVEDYGDDAFAPFQAELFFGLNVDARALSSTPMRKAIMLAIDREAIVEEVYPDLADPLTSVVPAGVTGHDPDRCPTCTPDPQGAADIVAFAYPNGDVPTVNIDYDESPPQEAMAELVAADLEAAGIPTHLRAYPLDEYEAFVVSGDQVLFSFGWIGAYVSPDAYLAPLFGSSANDNLTSYRSDQVDGLLERARASTNPILNADRWAAAEQTVLEAAVVVPIAQFRTQVVVAERVEGFEIAVDGTVDWARVTLTS